MLTFCNTCKFFTDKQGPGKTGTCRERPPQVILAGMEFVSRSPEVTPDMRACGRHEPNKRLINIENAAGNVNAVI